MIRARRLGVALAAAALLLPTACSSDAEQSPDPEPGQQPGSFTSYVAMGDSAVAGPDITPNDRRSGICARSKKNWPALLAESLTIDEVRDVSCSGAVSADISEERVKPAQIEALSAKTDLVTISIGGNDEGLFTKIILSCLYGPYDAARCESFITTQLDAIAVRTADRVALALGNIEKNAPNARVVLVGYLRILPDKGGCTMSSLSPERVVQAAKGMTALNSALGSAAKRARVDFVSMAGASVGHEACAKSNAWVNGLQSAPGDGALLHPNKAGMRAVAKILAEDLTKP